MPLFRRKTISVQFAEALLQDIRSGMFVGLLPSVRDLALRYQLNQVSVHSGLRLLVEQGALLSRGPRRRLVVNSSIRGYSAKDSAEPMASRRLLVFIGADHTQISPAVLLGMNNVENAIREKNGSCEVVELEDLSPEEVREQVACAVSGFHPTHVLLVYCDASVLQPLSGKGIKLAKMGGSVSAPGMLNLAVDLPLLSTLAFVHLQKLGHEKMRLLMLGRPPEKVVHRLLGDHSYVFGVQADVSFGGKLEHGSVCEAVSAALKDGVTAFVVPRPEDYVMVKTCLDLRKLDVPKDVSLVLLLGGPYDFMQSKKPAHFKFTRGQVQELVTGWVEFGENRAERITREVASKFHLGDSIGPVSRS